MNPSNSFMCVCHYFVSFLKNVFLKKELFTKKTLSLLPSANQSKQHKNVFKFHINFNVQNLRSAGTSSLLYSHLMPSVPMIHRNPNQDKVVIEAE